MRHQHAGLAVPDFPLAYGRIYPLTAPEFLQQVNALRVDVRDFHPVQAWHVHVHMAHRVLALVILAGAWHVARLARRTGAPGAVRRLTDLAVGLVAVQVLLGAWTVWSNKAADIATLHVVTGAALLVTAALATAWSRRLAGRVTASGPVMGMNPIETTGAAVAVSRG